MFLTSCNMQLLGTHAITSVKLQGRCSWTASKCGPSINMGFSDLVSNIVYRSPACRTRVFYGDSLVRGLGYQWPKCAVGVRPHLVRKKCRVSYANMLQCVFTAYCSSLFARQPVRHYLSMDASMRTFSCLVDICKYFLKFCHVNQSFINASDMLTTCIGKRTQALSRDQVMCMHTPSMHSWDRGNFALCNFDFQLSTRARVLSLEVLLQL